jgi:lactoylglutathione lyase
VAVELFVCIDVPDLEVGVAFYTGAGLGLAVGRRYGDAFVELTGAPVLVHLLPVAARDYGRHWTPVHLDFVVPSLEPALARAEAAGARRNGAIREEEWGRLAVLGDPFGNGFCLLQFVGRGYDLLATPRA